MISLLKGQIEENNLTSIILDVHGVGYKINCTTETAKELHIGNSISIHTFLDVKENALELYGFITQEDKRFFELLLKVNGVGPKTALNILNTTSSTTLIEGIASGDPKHLQEISGLPKKQSEKLVLTLKDKVAGEELDEKTIAGTSDAIEALMSLGYSRKDVRDILTKIDKKLSTEEIIREALKKLKNG